MRRSNLFPILMLVVILVGVAFLFVAISLPKVYQSHSVICIIKLPDDSGTDAKLSPESVATKLIASQKVVSEAAQLDRIKRKLTDDGFRSFPNAKVPADLESGLMDHLTVKVLDSPGNNVIPQNIVGKPVILRFACADSAESHMLMTAIVDAYGIHVSEVCGQKYKVVTLSHTTKGYSRNWWQQLIGG